MLIGRSFYQGVVKAVLWQISVVTSTKIHKVTLTLVDLFYQH